MPLTTDPAALGLLRAIIEEPGDDALRLIYADYLEEHGEDARAEFIRNAIRFPHSSFVALTAKDPFPLLGLTPGELRDVGYPPGEMRTWMWGECDFGLVVHDLGRDLHYRTDRGFIEGVLCPVEAWKEHGPAIAQAHPLERVEFVGKEPHNDGSANDPWTWFQEGDHEPGCPCCLPSWLLTNEFYCIWWPTPEAALAALSKRAIEAIDRL